MNFLSPLYNSVSHLMTPTVTALDNVYTLVFIFMQALASCFCPVYADKKLHEQQQQHVY